MPLDNGNESQELTKTEPVKSAWIAALCLVLVLGFVSLVLGHMARQTPVAVGSVMGLNVLGSVGVLAGGCFLLIADLISLWHREDHENERKKQQATENGSTAKDVSGGVWGRLIFSAMFRRLKEDSDKVAAKRERETRDAAVREAERQRNARVAAARENWLLRGHVSIIFGGTLILAGFFLPSPEPGGSDHSPMDAPVPSDTPTGP